VSGRFQNHLIAFARSYQDHTLVTVVPRFCTSLVVVGEYPLGQIWQDTAIQLPAASSWQNLLTEQSLEADQTQASQILSQFPVALLQSIS